VPVPTYRGSLVIAFGVNRSKSFDRTFTFDRGTPTTFSENALEQAYGGISEWSAGAGVEISPHIAIGTTLIYYHGDETYLWDQLDISSVQRIDSRNSKYSGVGIRLGMTAEINPYVILGLTIDSPIRFNVTQDYDQLTIVNGVPYDTIGIYVYDLQHPFIFNAGVAFRLKTLTLEADFGYADWSQLQYTSDPDKPYNQALQKYYSDVLQFRVGAEFVIPQYGAVLRGGFKHDPLPISGTLITNQIEKDRNSFSFGLGFLIDRMVMLDIAYARASFELYNGTKQLSEKFTSDRLLLSIGYRI
jgi:long-subunit fatty acid transport protein